MNEHPIHVWHRLVRERDVAGLAHWLDDDAVFLSPVVHAPQRGRALVQAYLAAALEVLGNPTFRYVREILGPSDAVLEFETELDGILVNGVDLIRWNAQGRVVEFKVMVRPLKAVGAVHQAMAARLQATRPGGASG